MLDKDDAGNEPPERVRTSASNRESHFGEQRASIGSASSSIRDSGRHSSQRSRPTSFEPSRYAAAGSGSNFANLTEIDDIEPVEAGVPLREDKGKSAELKAKHQHRLSARSYSYTSNTGGENRLSAPSGVSLSKRSSGASAAERDYQRILARRLQQASDTGAGEGASRGFADLDEVRDPPPIQDWQEKGTSAHVYPEDERQEKRRSWVERPDSRYKLPEPTPAEVAAETPTVPRRRGQQDEESQASWPLRSHPLNRSSPGQQADVPAAESCSSHGGATAPDIPTRQQRQNGSVESFYTSLYAVSYLIILSILGTLGRIGIEWLTFYPGAPVVTPVIWANAAGSFCLGFLAEDLSLFQHPDQNMRPTTSTSSTSPNEKEAQTTADYHKWKKSLPLYIGLAIGFCGSLTSFSSFERDVFLALSNDLPSPISHPYSPPRPSTTDTLSRNGGYSLEALLAIILLTLTLSLGALLAGGHLALFLHAHHLLPPLPTTFFRKIVNRAIVPIAWIAWLGAIFLAIWPPDRPNGPSSRGTWANETWRGDAIFACVFAPLGCLLRFWISMKLNPIMPSFPLGTFAVNVFGTAVLGMCFDLQHVRFPSAAGAGAVGGGRVGCQVLQGVMDGFCGALTTVSTFVLELKGLRRGHAYVYGVGSVGVGFGVLVVVMGSVRWSVGWEAVACVTGRS